MEQKLHIADYFTKENTMFVNGDDKLLATLKNNVGYNVVEFGMSENCDYKASNINENEKGTSFICSFKGKHIDIFIPVIGHHNISNALASVAVADCLNLDLNKVVKALATYKAPQMRQQIVKTEEFTIIDDSYNASPDSMFSAIDILASIKANKKIAVLADMLELGDYSETGHEKVGQYAKKAGIDFVISFGEEAKHISNGFGSDNSAHFKEFEKAKEFLMQIAKKGDAVLCKGSRGMQTDRFVKTLKGE